jgi:predicted small metal-binding protein
MMAKEMRCGDLMPGCNTVIEGKDEQEVVAKAKEHARRDHNIQTVTPDLEEKVRGAIHEKR